MMALGRTGISAAWPRGAPAQRLEISVGRMSYRMERGALAQIARRGDKSDQMLDQGLPTPEAIRVYRATFLVRITP